MVVVLAGVIGLALLLISGAVFISAVFKRRIELTMPIWMFFIIIILYFFSMFGAARAGVYTVCIIGLGGLIAGLVIMVRRKESLVKNLLTPGLVIFLALYLLSWWAMKNRLLISWDEFSHWALAVKDLYIVNGLWGAPGNFVAFNDYPPALALFPFLFTAFSPEFFEGDIFRAFHSFYFILFLPLFQNVSWKQGLKILRNLGVLLALPIGFYYSFYFEIYVDAQLGLLMAFMLFSYFTSKPDIFSAINLCLAAFVLSLIKESGAGLAIIVLLIILIDQIRFRQQKSVPLRKDLEARRMIGLPMIGLLTAKLSWSLYIKLAVSEASASIDLSLAGLFSSKTLGEYYTIVKNFLLFLPREYSASYSFSLSYLGWTAALILMAIIVITFGIKSKNQKRYETAAIGITVGGALYVFSLLCLYLFSFSTYEAEGLAAIERYLSTYLLASIAFWVCSAVIIDKSNPKSRIFTAATVITLLLLSVTNLTPVVKYAFLTPSRNNELIQERSGYEPIKQVLDVADMETDSVYYISIGESGYDYQLAKYLVAPVRLDGPWSIGPSAYYDGDIWTQITTLPEWEKTLEESYDYVYVFRTNNIFDETYGSIFKDGVFKNTLYQVTKTESGILLVAIP